jgi:hypothetical protein
MFLRLVVYRCLWVIWASSFSIIFVPMIAFASLASLTPEIQVPAVPNKPPEPTTMAVTIRAPSSTARASHGRGSS